MAIPQCPKCQNSTFQMNPLGIAGANFKHSAIVCSSCGCIVGTEELMSVMYMLSKIAKKLGVRFD
ncbi:hypothetical protein ACFLQR_01235 [Verrucomicrobiota bacterium]